MKKRMSKLLSLILAMSMILSLLPVQAFAREADYIYGSQEPVANDPIYGSGDTPEVTPQPTETPPDEIPVEPAGVKVDQVNVSLDESGQLTGDITFQGNLAGNNISLIALVDIPYRKAGASGGSVNEATVISGNGEYCSPTTGPGKISSETLLFPYIFLIAENVTGNKVEVSAFSPSGTAGGSSSITGTDIKAALKGSGTDDNWEYERTDGRTTYPVKIIVYTDENEPGNTSDDAPDEGVTAPAAILTADCTSIVGKSTDATTIVEVTVTNTVPDSNATNITVISSDPDLVSAFNLSAVTLSGTTGSNTLTFSINYGAGTPTASFTATVTLSYDNGAGETKTIPISVIVTVVDASCSLAANPASIELTSVNETSGQSVDLILAQANNARFFYKSASVVDSSGSPVAGFTCESGTDSDSIPKAYASSVVSGTDKTFHDVLVIKHVPLSTDTAAFLKVDYSYGGNRTGESAMKSGTAYFPVSFTPAQKPAIVLTQNANSQDFSGSGTAYTATYNGKDQSPSQRLNDNSLTVTTDFIWVTTA